MAEVDPHAERSVFDNTIDHLEKYRFWRGSGKILGLWENQQSAVALGIAYLHAERSLPLEGNVTEAALIKMPTGTGKSGVIAILTRCLSEVKKALVLTPRSALTEQLLEDIRARFWRNIGFEAPDGEVWTADRKAAGVDVEYSKVLQLLTSAANSIIETLAECGPDRVVLVGTLQALDAIRRTVDSRKQQRHRNAPMREDDQEVVKRYAKLLKLLEQFDLVIIDEGHYEPAPSWSRNVRRIDRPTILFSATPFRNDYKLFRVRGRFVFNMPIQEAWDRRIVRTVKFICPPSKVNGSKRRAPNSPNPGIETDTIVERRTTTEDRDEVGRFVQLLSESVPDLLARARKYTKTPKIIVRGGGFEVLQLLQDQIFKNFGEQPVLIHERVRRDNPAVRHFSSVRAATANAGQAQYWLHESKLLEGIDNPDFVAVAIYDPFSNARQLVQQVGRVIRSTDRARKKTQTAWVIVAPEMLEHTRSSWNRYRAFEDYCRQNVSSIVRSEAALPERVLEYMPSLQYVDGDFRTKYFGDGPVRAEDIRLPLRASIFLTEPSFDAAEAETEIEEAILAEDRFMPRRIEELPAGMFGRAYWGWRNTPYLVHQYMSEWTLGICIAARVGSLLFVQDTEGIVFDPENVGLKKANREMLLKAFPDDDNAASVVLTRMSSHSLDMSDRAIRTQATRTRSFATTFTDLLDPLLVPTSVYGFIGGGGRYLGIARGRISDASDEYVGIANLHEWFTRLAGELDEQSRKPSRVFDRYARPIVLSPEEAEPVSILLELTSETFREFGVRGENGPEGYPGHDMPYEDLCADISDGEFKIAMRDDTAIPCSIEYRPDYGRYRIISKELDRLHPPLSRQRAKRARTLTEQVNRDQSFRVLTKADGVVYTQGGFYATRDFVTPDGLVVPLESTVAVQALGKTVSEKGEAFFGKPKWRTDSVFGVFKAICEGKQRDDFGELGKALRRFELVLLDDGGDEIGDFLAIDRGAKRVALIHAKASKKVHKDGVTGLQIVGRQAIASLAFCSTQARISGIEPGRWKRPVIANTTRLRLSRLFRRPDDLDYNEIERVVKSALSNPSWSREVWIVAGRLLDVEFVRNRAVNKALPNHSRQLLMYLESLRTACGRANANLRIFGH